MQKLTDNINVLVILAMVGMFLLAGAFVFIQIAARNKIWLQKKKLLDTRIQHQQELLHAIISSQEEERKRIGMDLHDSVSSALSALRMMIEKLTRLHAGDPAEGELGRECKSIIDHLIGDVRDIAHNLSPPIGDAYYFSDVLEDLCDWVNRSGKIRVALHLPPEESILAGLDNRASLTLYRVLGELINNTIRHAGAERIDIHFTVSDGALLIEYRDNGIGLSGTAQAGMGLRNIESRLSYIGAIYKMDQAGPEGGGFRMAIKVLL